jgi:hypothetical protein
MMGDLSNPYLIIDEAEKELSLHLFDDLVNESGYSRAAIAELIGMDVRTVSNYKKTK